MLQQRERRIEKGLIDGRLSSSIWKLAFPMMIGGSLQDLFSIVDLYFVGRLGHVEVAALSIAGTVLSVLMMFVMGIAVGTVALVAHFTGDKQHERADEVLGQTLLLGLICSAIMLVVSLVAVVPLLRLFGGRGDVLVYAADYLRITFGWSLTIFLFVGVNHALRGSGDAKTPLKALVIANVINIFLDPMLIMGYGPFPRMGVAGSATATVLSRGIGFVYLILHTVTGDSTLQLRLRYLKPNTALMKRMISIGSFSSLQVLIREISFLFLLRLVASYGAITLAAYGIGSRLRMLIMVPGFGFATAASILMGQNMGANQPDRAKRSVWKTLKYYEYLAVSSAVLFFIFAPQLVTFFNDQPDVVRIGSSFTRYIAVTFPFLALSLVLSQGMNGAGDTFTPTIVNGIGQLIVRIPLVYYFALGTGLGTSGIWLGINISDLMQGLGMILIFELGYWRNVYYKHRRILEGKTVIQEIDT